MFNLIFASPPFPSHESRTNVARKKADELNQISETVATKMLDPKKVEDSCTEKNT